MELASNLVIVLFAFLIGVVPTAIVVYAGVVIIRCEPLLKELVDEIRRGRNG